MWELELSQTDPGDRTVPEFCKIGTENVSPPTPLFADVRYCCRSRLSQSDVATEDPTEVAQVKWLPVPASLYDVEILELTIVRKSDCPSNWRPIPREMHP